MSVTIRMLKTWEYWLDESGDTKRILPSGVVVEVDLETAAAAIAEGAAEANRAVSPELAAKIETHKTLIDNLAAGMSVEEAYAAAHGLTVDAGGNGGFSLGGDGSVKAKLLKAHVIDGERFAKGALVEGALAEALIAEGIATPVPA